MQDPNTESHALNSQDPGTQHTERHQASIHFEQQLAQLETLVTQLESGQLTLEDSLSAFEQGVQLTRQCQQQLEQAQLRVRHLQASTEAPTESGTDTIVSTQPEQRHE